MLPRRDRGIAPTDRVFRLQEISTCVIEEFRVLSGSTHSYSKTTRQFCQLGMLTAAGAIGAGSQAQATLFYWTETNPGYYRPEPMMQPRRQAPRSRQGKHTVVPQKEAKPKGPVIIAISIDKQAMKTYDANGFFASA